MLFKQASCKDNKVPATCKTLPSTLVITVKSGIKEKIHYYNSNLLAICQQAASKVKTKI
jgi:hypothetical protein